MWENVWPTPENPSDRRAEVFDMALPFVPAGSPFQPRRAAGSSDFAMVPFARRTGKNRSLSWHGRFDVGIMIIIMISIKMELLEKLKLFTPLHCFYYVAFNVMGPRNNVVLN